tara:strand:+ start:238 stop:753 length:516 start_codon:yes stop_codon:yes gene_type:complete
MRFFFITSFILLFSCSKPQTILICGNHKCVNKAEAEQYFEENLSLEVQIISKDKQISYNLVDLNLANDERNVKVIKKKDKKVVKKLSKNEIKEKKIEIKKKKKILEQNKQISKKEVNLRKKNKIATTSSNNILNNSLDICLKLEKCDIDSIAKYLIKESNEKDYPNISLKE